MATDFSFGIDWQRKGVICWDARPGDALNVLSRPMTYSALDFRTSGVVTSTTLTRLATPFGMASGHLRRRPGRGRTTVLRSVKATRWRSTPFRQPPPRPMASPSGCADKQALQACRSSFVCAIRQVRRVVGGTVVSLR